MKKNDDVEYCCEKINGELFTEYFNDQYGEKIVRHNRHSKPRTVTINFYNKNMQTHNENGPAYLVQDLDGNIINQGFCLFGVTLTEKEWQDKMETKLYW